MKKDRDAGKPSLFLKRKNGNMAKSTNHTAHNQSYKNHRNGTFTLTRRWRRIYFMIREVYVFFSRAESRWTQNWLDKNAAVVVVVVLAD